MAGEPKQSAGQLAERLLVDVQYAIKQLRVHHDQDRALDALERLSGEISDALYWPDGTDDVGPPFWDQSTLLVVCRRFRQRLLDAANVLADTTARYGAGAACRQNIIDALEDPIGERDRETVPTMEVPS